jgi:hypothetical protein
MTAAPTYTWKFDSDLFGTRTPIVTTLGVTAASLLKKGTLVSMVSGKVIATTDGTAQYAIGLAAEDITVSPSSGDPVKIEIIAPGMVIKGTSAADATNYCGFQSKAYDVDSDGRLDVTDVTGGGLSIWRVEDSGLTVYCTIATGAMI